MGMVKTAVCMLQVAVQGSRTCEHTAPVVAVSQVCDIVLFALLTPLAVSTASHLALVLAPTVATSTKYSTTIRPSTDTLTYPAHKHMHQHPACMHTTSPMCLCHPTCTPVGAAWLKHVGPCHRGSLGHISASQTHGGQGWSKYTQQQLVVQGVRSGWLG